MIMLRLLGLLILIRNTSSVEYKIGMIVARNCCHRTSLYRTGGAVNIAMDHLRANNIVNGVDFRIIVRDTLTEAEGVGNVVTLVRDDDVDVIFGNPSSDITVPSAYLTSHWNFPQISWAATIPTLTDKNVFTTYVRTLGTYSMIGIAFVSIFEKFNWHSVGMMYADSGGCLWAMDGIVEAFQKTNISIVQRIEYILTRAIPDHDLDRYLLMLKRQSRIIILCDKFYLREIMIRACEMNMCNGDYVFMLPGITVEARFDEQKMWYKGDERDAAAQNAFKYLLYVTYANWYGNDGKEKYIQFMEDVIDRTMDPPWNDDTAKVKNVQASPFSMNLFDAMYVYGLWVNYTITNGVDHKDGKALMEYVNGLRFVSPISGPSHFENGDRVPLYWIWDFTHEEGYGRIAAISNTVKETNMLEDDEWKGFEWQTLDGRAPPDSPQCGFFNELCPEVIKDNSVVILVTCLCALMLTLAGSVFAYVYRKRQLEYTMMRMIWKVEIDEIELQKSRTGAGSKINISNTSQTISHVSVKSEVSANTAISGSVKGPVLTPVGLFKGHLVAVKQLPNFPVELSRSDLMDLKEMRELQHDNINPFLGACINALNPCALYLYCPKGSLQDILENDDIDLDLVFKNSLMMDLAEGMYYLHGSGLGVHGRLKSTNCLVDSRWVLKITDYGLNPFMGDIDISKFEEAQHYKSLLWTAPELLTSTVCPRNGTKAGDVYSFGIILHEIFYRMGTFAGKSYMTAKDIIGRVRNRETTPCRPEIFSDITHVTPTVSKLMQLCWTDNEANRPTFSHVRSYIRKNIKGISKNIVDIILQRLEKYASNLEVLVDQRTHQLMEEKQKTDKLLYRMLPPSCADVLKAGDIVQPEVFESATVFFSDIVGFTTIAAMSTPIQVIDLLNDLYTCFDDIIAKHDAYKVETIGDAYLVVSGIPNRNGNRHAGLWRMASSLHKPMTGEIADLSLNILSALLQFRPKHLPELKIRVRIGIHTGSCCAGVVGLSMPRYCLFGDTVNTASRMESTGMENRIHISEAACKALIHTDVYLTSLRGEIAVKGSWVCVRLSENRIHISEATCKALIHKDGYLTSLRGEITVKGKGVMRTYWLDGKEGFDGALPHLVE